jgi:hypothetical protein
LKEQFANSTQRECDRLLEMKQLFLQSAYPHAMYEKIIPHVQFNYYNKYNQLTVEDFLAFLVETILCSKDGRFPR